VTHGPVTDLVSATVAAGAQPSGFGGHPVGLLAQENGGVLARSFLIAVVVMAPVALWQWSRVRARRRDEESVAEPDGDDGPDPGDQGTWPAADDPSTVEWLVRRVGALATELEPGSSATIEVPEAPTLGGRPAPPGLVGQLLDDALHRGGLEGGLAGRADGSTVLECRRPGHGARLGP
jgi:hypothetical protein